MPEFKPSFMATGTGSMPLADPEEALDLVLAYLPEFPYWPQLTPRSPWEDMTLQAAPGLPLVKVDLAGRLVSLDADQDRTEALTSFYEADLSGDLERFCFDLDMAPGYFALKTRLVKDPGRVRFLKGHVTGPITFGLTVKDRAGKVLLYDQELLDACARGLGLRGAWQVRNLPALGPVLISLDEPGLSGFGSAFLSLEKAEATRLLNLSAEPIRQAGGIASVHCCGNTDWSIILESQVDVVNFDAFGYGENFVIYPKEIAAFLERGGVLAWGIVPTLEYTGKETPELLARKLDGLMDQLVQKGLDRNRIFEQSLLMPACGLGPLDLPRAEGILKLLAATSRLMRGEAGGRGFSVDGP